MFSIETLRHDMSLINKQLTELLKDRLQYNNPNLNAKIKFDKNFIGFQGHFPGNPVLPGVVMIKIMTIMLELFNKKKYILSQIKQAKFIEPVFADMTTLFTIKSEKDKDGIKLQGKVFKLKKIIAKISLVLQ
jgi:3-hydroxyacyl-[acyl-carrier-protein] dehydratase